MVWGLNPGREKRFLSSPKCPDWLWSPTTLLFNGYGGSFPGEMQPGHEVRHSPPSRREYFGLIRTQHDDEVYKVRAFVIHIYC
jgi:hypothetical protein